jgi:hypothetical protein
MFKKKGTQLLRSFASKRFLITVLFAVFFMSFTLGAQTKQPASFSDYGQWETLARGGSNGGLSPDGKWLAYGINRTNGKNELRITKIADGHIEVVAFGSQPVFSVDSRWVAYRIGYSEDEQEKLRKSKKPVQNKLGLMNLTTGKTSTIDTIESFSFSSDGAYLMMRRYRPEQASGAGSASGRGGGSGDSGDQPEEPIGTTIIIRQLSSSRDTTFGNVSQNVWQDAKNTHLLAMTISADGKAGNGVHLFDPETTVLRVLDSSSSVYTGLVWRKDAADLAVFRAETDDKMEGPTHVLLSWTSFGETERQFTYNPTSDSSFPEGMRTVTFRPLSWSDDGKVLFFGIAPWEDKIIRPEKK